MKPSSAPPSAAPTVTPGSPIVVTSSPIIDILSVHKATLTALESALRDPHQADEVLEKLRQEIAGIVKLQWAPLSHTPEARTTDVEKLFRILPLLGPSEYAVPPALRLVDAQIQQQLASKEGNDHFSYSGLFLYGPPGTGKSEYIRYLGQKLSDKVIVYIAETARIRNSKTPAEDLTRLYRYLEKQAEETGKYIVLFFDEFDIFMTPHSSIKNERTTNTHATSERSATTSTTKSEVTLDPIGSQLFATTKSLMSGDAEISRVFTVANTNQDGLPEALGREGRFQSVRMDFPFSQLQTQQDPDYKDYVEHILYALEVFAATHCRLFGLTKMPKEFQQAIKECQKLAQSNAKILPRQPRKSGGSDHFGFSRFNAPQLSVEQKQKIRTGILDFLEVPEGEIRRTFYQQSTVYTAWTYREIVQQLRQLSQWALASIYKKLGPKETPNMPQIKWVIAEMFLVEKKRGK